MRIIHYPAPNSSYHRVFPSKLFTARVSLISTGVQIDDNAAVPTMLVNGIINKRVVVKHRVKEQERLLALLG